MPATAMPARPAPRSAGRGDAASVPAASDVTGVVLCGGASRRFGRDKALADLGGRPLIARSIDALREVAGRVLLATGADERYRDLGCERVLDPFPGAGPLAGLLAGLEAARTEWVAVLACDMPRASAAALRQLLAEAVRGELDLCLAEAAQGSEPLLAVYRRRCAPAVRAALEAGERRMLAFHAIPVDGRPLRAGRLALADAGSALNVNTPGDLEAEGARERGAR